jgi:thiamine kinase-like enzyme
LNILVCSTHLLISSTGYDPLVVFLQNGEVDSEVAKAVGAIMGNCHADTHNLVVGTEVSKGYAVKYSNKEHFDLWDKHFFPMSLTRLAVTSLFKQTADIAQFGDEHYDAVRKYLESEDVGEKTRDELIKAIEEVRYIYLNKKTTLIHADLHSNNIMVRRDNFHPHRIRFKVNQGDAVESSGDEDGKSSCDLTKVRMIDFEKFAYGPPGIDLGQYMANYIYFMPIATYLPVTEWQQTSLINLRQDELYEKFEDSLRSFWVAYVEAFDMHTEQMSKKFGKVMLSKTRNEILQENLRDAVGFIGWWMFSLVASCPVDVMPIPRPLVRATIQKKPLSVSAARIIQLKIAIAALKTFYANEKLDFSTDNRFWIDFVLKMVKKNVFSDNWNLGN